MDWYSVTYYKNDSEVLSEERFTNQHEALRFISRLESNSVRLTYVCESISLLEVSLGTWFDGANNVSVTELEKLLESVENQIA